MALRLMHGACVAPASNARDLQKTPWTSEQGRHAIVTGGSRSVGKAIARELAREGVRAAIMARNKADLEATSQPAVPPAGPIGAVVVKPPS